jgi:phosphoserine phosphatase
MHIGIDLDNTLVCYDELFWRLAAERGWIDASVPPRKDCVRDALRVAGREADWTWMQGEAYGLRMEAAVPFPGAKEALQTLHEHGHQVSIVSHRTRLPIAGPSCDLHEAAVQWLSSLGFLDRQVTGLALERVFLEVDKVSKLARIAAIDCEWFVDDLRELLTEPAFPSTVRRVLFDPHGQHRSPPEDIVVVPSWTRLATLVTEGGA